VTSTKNNNLEQAVLDFQELDIDDRLLLLALTYHQFINSLPLDNWAEITQTHVHTLVQQIQQLPLEEQLTFLSEALAKEKDNQEKILLDTNHELNNSNFYPTRQYRLLNDASKLAVWYLIAENLAEIISDIPGEYSPTPAAIELFNTLKSWNRDRLVSFLKQVL
jgi:hypothetical protein